MDILKQVEAIPDTYPDVPTFDRGGYIDEVQDAPVSVAQVWQRIEAYIAHRYSPRAVVWTVQGPGEWNPPLYPVNSISAEIWNGSTWQEAIPAASPLGGFVLGSEGPYRFIADVGGGDVPAAVSEAYKRLSEYTRGINDSFKNEAAIISYESGEVARNWTAKALQLSGAADLLRNYRRV